METLHLPETLDKATLDRIERVIAYKNVQFIIDHQHDTPEQLSAYLKTCMDELGHVPAKVEVIGGDYLEYRFGTWRKALGSFYSGSIASSKNPPPFAARKIVRDLYALELRRKERSAGEASDLSGEYGRTEKGIDPAHAAGALAQERGIRSGPSGGQQAAACRLSAPVPGGAGAYPRAHRGDRRRSHRAALPGLGERPVRQRRPGGAGHPARPPRADEDRPFPEGI